MLHQIEAQQFYTNFPAIMSPLGGSEKYMWPILLICIVDKSLCEACPLSFKSVYFCDLILFTLRISASYQ